MKKQIELAIARLERANAQIKQLLDLTQGKLSEEQQNELLDEYLKNEQLIKKLKKGL